MLSSAANPPTLIAEEVNLRPPLVPQKAEQQGRRQRALFKAIEHQFTLFATAWDV
jgi:hypothetical protein